MPSAWPPGRRRRLASLLRVRTPAAGCACAPAAAMCAQNLRCSPSWCLDYAHDAAVCTSAGVFLTGSSVSAKHAAICAPSPRASSSTLPLIDSPPRQTAPRADLSADWLADLERGGAACFVKDLGSRNKARPGLLQPAEPFTGMTAPLCSGVPVAEPCCADATGAARDGARDAAAAGPLRAAERGHAAVRLACVPRGLCVHGMRWAGAVQPCLIEAHTLHFALLRCRPAALRGTPVEELIPGRPLEHACCVAQGPPHVPAAPAADAVMHEAAPVRNQASACALLRAPHNLARERAARSAGIQSATLR